MVSMHESHQTSMEKSSTKAKEHGKHLLLVIGKKQKVD